MVFCESIGKVVVVSQRGRGSKTKATTNRVQLIEKLRVAKDYKEWLDIALQLDALPVDTGEGGNDWKRDETSDAYDYALVRGIRGDYDCGEGKERRKRDWFSVANGFTQKFCWIR